MNNTLSINDLEINSNSKLSDYSDQSDPTYIGPGKWNDIHQLAFDARTLTTQKEFIQFMNNVADKFPCDKCRKHCKEYMLNHPIKDYIGIKVVIENKTYALGMFVWSWKFHNSVNARLNKPLMRFETAYNIYLDQSNCGISCNNSK